MSLARTLCLASVLISFGGGLAQAQYDGMDCDQLYYERNSIYKNKGYCFQTARAIATFGNAGCSYDNVYDVPLSPRETRAIAGIKASERYQGCAR